MITWIRKSLIVTMALCTWAATDHAYGQLADEVKEMFERLVEDIDEDLAVKFKRAIKKSSATIEFTPEQFRRFRDHPANPFDGLNEVEAEDGGGNIALKFELPSIRHRKLNPRERQDSDQLAEFSPVISNAAASTVGIFRGDKQVSLGIVVDASGLILTKASEVDTEKELICRLPNGKRIPIQLIRADERNDVAIMSVDNKQSGSLQPVRWSENQPLLGSFVIAPGFDGKAVSWGTYSSNVRSTVSGEQAFLGVQPQTTPQGVLISDIRPGSASYAAGLRDGDVIKKIAGQTIKDVTDLVHLIRSKRPGDRVEIAFLRNGVDKTAMAELSGRRLSGERAARFKMMSRLGAIPSRRADGFPAVFQHDAPLFPEHCGGPVVDLDGNVIGMNIARNGRAASYAIPAKYVQSLVESLIARSDLAQRQEEPALTQSK